MKDNKTKWQVIIPVVLALLVVIGFAVSGYVTKSLDKESPTAAETTTETASESTTASSSEVSLVAVGDNLIHNTLIAAGEKSDGSRNYSAFYENVKKYISSADVAVINQETMLGGSSFDYAGYPCFNTPWEVGDAAIDAGFDIFTCATNHSMDVGFSGIEQECKYFENHKDVVHVGTYATEEESKAITYYTKNNIKFAILNYTFGTNGISRPDGKEWCVSMLDKDKVTSDIKTAKENADVVMVFPHWGTENSTEVSDYQKEYTSLFASLDVDIVIGAHPHVLQPVEWVSREDGKKMLVYYSLGNFISHQTSLNQLCGGMAEINIEKKNGEISISSAKLAPVVCYYKKSGSGYQFAAYKLADYSSDIASSHAQKGATPEYFTKYAEKIVPEEFLDLK